MRKNLTGKRGIAAILCLTLLLALLPWGALAVEEVESIDIPDLDLEDPKQAMCQIMADRYLIITDDENYFHPEQVMSRGEYFYLLNAMLGMPLYDWTEEEESIILEGETMIYADLGWEDDYAWDIYWAASWGIIPESMVDKQGRIHSEVGITNEQAVMTLYNALLAMGVYMEDIGDISVDGNPDGSEVSEDARHAYAVLLSFNVFDYDELLYPQDTLTRENAADIVGRMFEAVGVAPEHFGNYLLWQDLGYDVEFYAMYGAPGKPTSIHTNWEDTIAPLSDEEFYEE